MSNVLFLIIYYKLLLYIIIINFIINYSILDKLYFSNSPLFYMYFQYNKKKKNNNQ